MSRRLKVRGLVGAILGTAACGAGCNLIAGIDEGVLVDARADVASDDGGRRPDAPGRRDATTDGRSHDGGRENDGSTHDATVGDGGTPEAGHREAGLRDAGHEAALGPLVCTYQVGSKVTVADLATADAGVTTFNGVYIAPNGGSTGFTVITEIAPSSGSEVLAYTVTAPTSTRALAVAGSVLDVNTSPQGTIEVLTSVGGSGASLQVLTGTQAGNLSPSAAFGASQVRYNGGRLADLPANSAYPFGYAVVSNPQTGSPYSLTLGVTGIDGGPPGTSAYEQSTNFGFTNNAAFFAAGGSIYALMNQVIVDAGGDVRVEPEFFAKDDDTQSGLAGSLTLPATAGALIAVRKSASDSSKVVVLGGQLGSDGMSLVPCGITVDPAMIPTLTLCGSGFGLGAPLSFNDVSFGGSGGTGWNTTTDDLLSVGPNGTKSALSLLWLAGDGRVVANQPSILATGVVTATAVQFENFVSESFTYVDVAWIEQNAGEGGTLPEKIVAASLTCSPQADP